MTKLQKEIHFIQTVANLLYAGTFQGQNAQALVFVMDELEKRFKKASARQPKLNAEAPAPAAAVEAVADGS